MSLKLNVALFYLIFIGYLLTLIVFTFETSSQIRDIFLLIFVAFCFLILKLNDIRSER